MSGSGHILYDIPTVYRRRYNQWRIEGLEQRIVGVLTIVIPGLLFFLGGNGFGILGLKTVSSGPAALLVAIAPVFMALIDLVKPDAPKMNNIGI